MSRLIHLILQAAGFLVQYGTSVSGYVPAKYQKWVHLAVGLAQAFLLWKSAEYNTDGTPQTTAFVKKAVLPLVILFLMVPAAMSQVTVSASLQPYKAVKSTVGSIVTLYATTTCSGSTMVDTDYGRVRQALSTKIATTANPLVGPTLNNARNKNNWVKAFTLTRLALDIVSPLAVGDIIKASRSIQVALVAARPAAQAAGDYFQSQGPPGSDTIITTFLPDAGPLHLNANQCVSHLVMGQYIKGLNSFNVVVDGVIPAPSAATKPADDEDLP